MHIDKTPLVPDPDEVGDDEHRRSLFAIGKLVHDGRQHICRVCSVSDHGVDIRIERPPAAGARVVVSLRGLPPTEAEVCRVDGERVDLIFCRPTSTLHIGGDAGLAQRSPRFDVDRPAVLHVGTRSVAVRALDISLGGVKLAVPCVIPVGATNVLIEGDIAPLRGRVCWSSAVAAGLRFSGPLPLSRLAAMVGQGKHVYGDGHCPPQEQSGDLPSTDRRA